MSCLRTGCGHSTGQHEATGPCLTPGCTCPGYKAKVSKAEAAARLTRCSDCKRRPLRDGLGWRNHGRGCSRYGAAPDAREDAGSGA